MKTITDVSDVDYVNMSDPAASATFTQDEMNYKDFYRVLAMSSSNGFRNMVCFSATIFNNVLYLSV